MSNAFLLHLARAEHTWEEGYEWINKVLFDTNIYQIYPAKETRPSLYRLREQFIDVMQKMHSVDPKCIATVIPEFKWGGSADRIIVWFGIDDMPLEGLGGNLDEQFATYLRNLSIMDQSNIGREVLAASLRRHGEQWKSIFTKMRAYVESGVQRITVDLERNLVSVDGTQQSIEPHLAKMLNAFVQARNNGGNSVVSSKAILELPGCGRKNINRELDKLYELFPALESMLKGKKGSGRWLDY